MIEVSDELASVLAGPAIEQHVSIESWLDGELLADDIPYGSPVETGDRDSRVPEGLSFVVPREDRGVIWAPTSETHPLAANGQRLRVEVGVTTVSGRVEWVQRGWFLVQDAWPDGDRVEVQGVGLLGMVEEARLVSPYQPSGTFKSTVRGLVEPALTVRFDAALVDRSVPAGLNYDEDRIGALYEVLDAWPAQCRVDIDGVLSVEPVDQSATPVFAYTHGYGGTIVRYAGQSNRDGHNAVVARGTQSDGAQIQATAYIGVGPKRFGGPWNPLPVPEFFYSPLLTTFQQCLSAANTIAKRRIRQQANTYTVECIYDPRIELGDIGTITTADFADKLVSVESIRLPYIASSMILTVREVPTDD